MPLRGLARGLGQLQPVLCPAARTREQEVEGPGIPTRGPKDIFSIDPQREREWTRGGETEKERHINVRDTLTAKLRPSVLG